MTQAHLVLADGTTYTGTAFGASGTTVGEVVFNTGMTGYQEILTDPSYAGQLVALTYPIIGNYGVTPDDFESHRVQVAGFIVKELADAPSNWRSQGTLDGFLKTHGVVGIAGLDTRALTRKLRSVGVMMGAISSDKTPDDLRDLLAHAAGYADVEYVQQVTTPDPYVWPSATGETKYRIALLDCGVKFNILRSLASLGAETTVFPSHTPAETILATDPDGIFLSPGPGDPALLGDIVQTVRVLSHAKPTMGICLGNQLIGCAFGGRTFKLPFGHRGSNHPVKDLGTGRVVITSQNHGYALAADGFDDPDVEVWQINLNDGTVEGLRHKTLPVFSIQYHPEASPGPADSRGYFARFLQMIDEPGHKTALGLLLVACLATRLLALDADPPRWLSWSMGTQTDEGFYTLDARHEALFGAWAPGNFHDRLVSPLLSLLQQAIFHTIGVGTVQARLISVTFGLLTIFAFWYGLRAAYGDRVALWGAFLLGLSPPVVFYNRLALQETPTVFWLVLAFALWCAAGKQGIGRAHGATLALSGLCVAAALIFKALAIIALPAFLLVWYRSGGRAAFVGLTAALLLYGLLWYGPHHAELSRMAAYYRTHQFEPHSPRSVWLNIRRGFVDTQRGLAPYLLRLTPVPCLLALASLRRRAATPDIALATWLLGGLAFCLLSSYAPDRYYVLFFPAMTALAAVGAARLPRSWQLVGAGLFLVTSGYWYRSAWQGRGYARRDAARLLTRTLPAGSVLVGEMAPALGLDTPFRAAPVQPGLSNDDRPAERLGATHVLVTRAPRQTRWWRTHEPQAVQPSRRVLSLPLQDRQGDVVDVYAVGKEREPMTETNLKTGLRVVLAAGMVYAGIAHFRNPAPFVSIVPDWLPAHRALVAVSGAFEIAGGVGLLPPPTRRAAAWGLIALFVAVFPANVNMALRDIPLEGRHFPPWALWLRLPLQALLIAWAWWYTQKEVETPPTPNSPGDAREIA